jgi:aspartate racemase
MQRPGARHQAGAVAFGGDNGAMRTIGLLGGMSWESSIVYYRLLNQAVRDRLGGLHSAQCVMWSVDFAGIEALQRSGDWNEAGRRLAELSRRLEEAGAECLVLCTNTMHRLADDLQAAIDIPLLHIADATAGRIKAGGIDTVGLLATRYTMEQDFYLGRLADRHGLRVLVPAEPDLTLVHEVIYGELCRGRVLEGSRDAYRRVISELEAAGARGIIFGCTEIDLLVGPDDASVPVFDSTRIHVEAAVDWALGAGAAGRPGGAASKAATA